MPWATATLSLKCSGPGYRDAWRLRRQRHTPAPQGPGRPGRRTAIGRRPAGSRPPRRPAEDGPGIRHPSPLKLPGDRDRQVTATVTSATATSRSDSDSDALGVPGQPECQPGCGLSAMRFESHWHFKRSLAFGNVKEYILKNLKSSLSPSPQWRPQVVQRLWGDGRRQIPDTKTALRRLSWGSSVAFAGDSRAVFGL